MCWTTNPINQAPFSILYLTQRNAFADEHANTNIISFYKCLFRLFDRLDIWPAHRNSGFLCSIIFGSQHICMRCGLVVFGSVFATQPILDSTCQSHRCSAYGKGVVDLVGCPMDKRITLLLRGTSQYNIPPSSDEWTKNGSAHIDQLWLISHRTIE